MNTSAGRNIRNIKLTIRYDGTRYGGWQSQKNSKAIQDVVKNAVYKTTGENVKLTGSGRTDAGVHATGQVANFKTHSKLSLKTIQMALNYYLPKDIVVSSVSVVHTKFDAQRSARSKSYRYTVANDDFVDPIIRHFASRCFHKLNISSMKKAAKFLIGKHDFKSFQTKSKSDDPEGTKDTVRTIKYIRVEKDGKLVYICMEADGFLYNMARNIVGTLIEIGRGRLRPSVMKDILKKKDRRFCGPTMPAKGLCLIKVRY